jgi:electron transfer flavoprotein alpha subunit
MVVCEARGDDYRPATYELLAQARRLVAGVGGEVVAVTAAGEAGLRQKLDGLAHRVIAVTGDGLAPYTADAWVEALSSVLGAATAGGGAATDASPARPRLVLFGESARTRELLPRLAARMGAWAVTNAVDLTADGADGGDLAIRRPVMGGKAYAAHAVGDGPVLAAFRPHSFGADAPAGLATAAEEVAAPQVAPRVTVVATETGAARRVDLTEANVVVSGGRGMKGPENFHLLEELADALEGAVGYSRAVVDAGQAEHADQVGKSGKTVSPTLYVAAGISGAIHHIMGMDTAKVVVAINTDPSAPIFGYADYGVLGDALQVLPALTEEIRRG